MAEAKMATTNATEFAAMIDGAVAEGDTLVTIIVGSQNSKTYRLSRNKLIRISGYFKAAFEGEWIEGQTQTLSLEEEEPLLFDLIIQWIYMRLVVLPHPSGVPRTAAQDISTYLKFCKLAD